MAITTKHKLFLVPIIEGSINLKDKVLEDINAFLSNENYEYINHSLTVLSKDEYITISPYTIEQAKRDINLDKFFKHKNANTFCLVSLIYKDLKDSENDVSKLSEKSKKVVKQVVQSGKKLPKPTLK